MSNAIAQPRPDTLKGATYKAKVEIDTWKKPNMYITINECNGLPFEIFVRQDNPELHEWIAAITLLVTRHLRDGGQLIDIAKELQQIHGPKSSHMIPGTNTLCPSIPARIGTVLQRHCELMKQKKNGIDPDKEAEAQRLMKRDGIKGEDEQ